MTDDPQKKEYVRKILKIVTKVDFPDGSWIGAGFLEDPEFKGTNIGIQVTDRFGKAMLGFEMNAINLLVLAQVINIIVRMQLEQEAGGIARPGYHLK